MGEGHSGALEVCEFVMGRLEERAHRAAGAGDDQGRSFVMRSHRILEQMRLDLVERPWAHREVEGYLLRTARQYRSHPDCRSSWG